MTSNDITFIFKKDTGSLNPHYLDALQGTTRIDVNGDAISNAVLYVFGQLIAKDTPKFEKAILGLNAFSVTFINGDQPKLKVESRDVEIHLNKLSAKTAALFFNSIPAPLNPGSKDTSAEAQNRANKLHQEEKPKTQQPLKPVPAAVVAKPIVVQAVQVAIPVALPVPAAVTKGSIWGELTEQDQMFSGISVNMHKPFVNTWITRSNGNMQNFGDYLMDRLFGQATSHHYNSGTGEFTIIFDEGQAFNLTKLPEGISAETGAGLKQLQKSILKLPNQVKGKFSENKVFFESESLTITWRSTWTGAEAKLLEIYESRDDTITMLIKYGRMHAQRISVPAQDFANFVECNITK